MKTRSLILVAVAGMLAYGCAPMMPSPPPGARSAGCDTASPGAQCSVAIQPGSRYRCAIGTFDVDPDTVELRGGRPVNIFWSLPEPYGFCDQDQVYLKPGLVSDVPQVFESFGSETEDGARGPNLRVAGTCKPKWHWNWSNRGTSTYAYNIQFTDKRTGQKCTIDPFIRNG